MNLASFALRNLTRRPLRTAVVTLSVGLAVGAALALAALSAAIERSAAEGVGEHGADMTIAQRDASDLFSSTLPETIGPALAALPGVRDIAPDLVLFAPVDRDRQKLIFGWPNDSFSWREMPLLAGRAPTRDEARVAVLGAGAAQQLSKGVGDAIDIADEAFVVIGIADYATTLNRASVFVPLAALQEATFRPGQVTGFHLTLHPGLSRAEVEALRATIAGLGRMYAAPTEEMLRSDRNLNILKAVSRSISWIALGMGALSVLNALLMAVQERTREIGVMSAIGWRRGRTMASIVLEGAYIGAMGCALGAGFGYSASFLFSSVPTIGDYIAFHPTPVLAASVLAASLALCVVGSLYPAWRATGLSPAEALRRA